MYIFSQEGMLAMAKEKRWFEFMGIEKIPYKGNFRYYICQNREHI